MRTITVIGSTGSIGRQTLDVLEGQENLKVIGLSCGNNNELLEEQIRRYSPPFAASLRRDPDLEDRFPETLFFWGIDGIENLLDASNPDCVMLSVSGVAGLRFSMKATTTSKRICLANKETLVCGGRVFLDAVERNQVELIPVDSEHSAVFQLMKGDVFPKAILITASGGAVRDIPKEQLKDVSVSRILNHPVWNMGRRVTIDSATMVNKGLEVIEAHYLFGIPEERVLTLMCRNGVIHGGVIYEDGTVKLHIGNPDMRIPISYSLGYPERLPIDEKFDLVSEAFSLERIDKDKYPALTLAREIAGDLTKQIVYNASDEIGIEAFVDGKIRFSKIYEVICRTVNRVDLIAPSSYNEIMEIDRVARIIAEEEVLRCSSP